RADTSSSEFFHTTFLNPAVDRFIVGRRTFAGGRATNLPPRHAAGRRFFRRDDNELDVGPFRQRRTGNDDAVGHDAGDGGGHGFLLPSLIVTSRPRRP